MPDRIDVIVVEQGTQRGIAGVAVTTGDGVATTGADGTCAIEVDPLARFAWMCATPRAATYAWYRLEPTKELHSEGRFTSISFTACSCSAVSAAASSILTGPYFIT